jgi:hypothetical protein
LKSRKTVHKIDGMKTMSGLKQRPTAIPMRLSAPRI